MSRVCPVCLNNGNSDTACSRIHNRAILTLSMLSTSCPAWEPNASSEEKITKTEEFICTLSSTSDESLEAEMSVYSMWTDATRMCKLLEKRLQLDGTMRQKMETLLQEDYLDQATDLASKRYGIRSAEHKMWTSFGNYARVWLREHSCVISSHFEASPIGAINPSLLHMNNHGEFKSTRGLFRHSMDGYSKTLFDA